MNIIPRCFRRSLFAALASLAFVSVSSLHAADMDKAVVPPTVLKKYDKDKNGALDEKETAKWEADKAERREKDRLAREARLAKYDTDKDGKLSDDEKAVAKIAMEKDRTERDMVKGKEKAGERIAREAATAAASAQPAAGTSGGGEMSGTTGQAMDGKPKDEEKEKPAEGTMMMQ